MRHSDEHLLAEAKALDDAYTSAALVDAQNEIKYLKQVLEELVVQINQDVPVDSVTRHFWDALQDAEEALGYYEDPACK